MNLNLDHLRDRNVARCKESSHPLEDWSPTDWACAMAGECGEACNLIKKRRRGQSIATSQIADELADLVIYADLLAARLEINLGAAIICKFNKISQKIGSDIVLGG